MRFQILVPEYYQVRYDPKDWPPIINQTYPYHLTAEFFDGSNQFGSSNVFTVDEAEQQAKMYAKRGGTPVRWRVRGFADIRGCGIEFPETEEQ